MPTKKQKQRGSRKAQRTQGSVPEGARYLNLQHAAAYMDRSVYSVRTLIWNGKIPHCKEDRKYWLDVRDIDDYMSKIKRLGVE